MVFSLHSGIARSLALHAAALAVALLHVALRLRLALLLLILLEMLGQFPGEERAQQEERRQDDQNLAGGEEQGRLEFGRSWHGQIADWPIRRSSHTE